jgi:hypothetical protein
MIAYKVVRANMKTRKMVSVYTPVLGDPRVVVEYEVDKTATRPLNAGPLAAFEEYGHARNWIDILRERAPSLWCHGLDVVILKCRVARSTAKRLWIDKNDKLRALPRGTIFCERITPLEILGAPVRLV